MKHRHFSFLPTSFTRIAFVCLCSLALLLPLIGQAYSVTPLVIDRSLKVRDADTVPITIKNPSNRPVRLYATVNAIAVNESGDITEFIQPTEADSKTMITSWLSVSRQRIEIPPGGEYETSLGIRLPSVVEPGEYHAFVGFPNASNRPQAESLLQTSSAPGVVVRIEVERDTVALVRLKQFFIDRFMANHEAGVATVLLANTGSEDVTPRGEIVFYDTAGSEVEAVSFNVGGSQIVSGDERTFTVEIPDNLGFGKYKAFLDIDYGNSQTAQVQDTTFFYIVPLYQLVIVFITLLLLTLYLAFRVQRRQARDRGLDGGASSVPFVVRTDASTAQDHDIDLKKTIE